MTTDERDIYSRMFRPATADELAERKNDPEMAKRKFFDRLREGMIQRISQHPASDADKTIMKALVALDVP